MKTLWLALCTAALVVAVVLVVNAFSAGEAPSATAGSEELRWGDMNCTRMGEPTDVSEDDVFSLMQFIGLGDVGSPVIGCPLIGAGLIVQGFGFLLFGDNDCSGGIGPYDALVALLSLAALTLIISGCPSIGTPFDYAPALADVKVQSFGIEASPPYSFTAGTLEPFALKLAEAKHNNGPQVALVDVAWTVEKVSGEPFVGFRWAAESGDICTQNGDFVPCGEGDTAGEPSVDGDNCFDGIDNDANGTADLFGTGPADPDPSLASDPACGHFINDLHFTIEPPVSASFILERFLSVQCNAVGSFIFRAENLETVKPPYSDPEPTNNARSFEEEGTCE